MNLITAKLTALYAAIVAAFAAPATTDSILQNLNAQVEALRAVATSHRDAADAKYALVEVLEDEADGHIEESIRAARVAANFERLLG